MFTGDLLVLRVAANSLDPFALWTAFPSSDYYESSAPHRQHRPATGLPTG